MEKYRKKMIQIYGFIMKSSNAGVTRVLEEEKEPKIKVIVKEMLPNNFLLLTKYVKLQIQKHQAE